MKIVGFWKTTATISIIILLGGISHIQALEGDLPQTLRQMDQGFRILTEKNELDEEIRISIQVPEINLGRKELPEGIFTTLDIAEAGFTAATGKPMLPQIGKFYQISDTLAPEVTVNIIKSHIMKLDYPVLPYQDDQEACDVKTIENLDAATYSMGNWYPEKRFLVMDPVILRDVRLLPAVVYPIRYHALSKTLEIIDEMELVIRFHEDSSENILRNIGPYSPTYEQFYKAIVPNYQPRDRDESTRGEAEHYLLIMDDEFEARCQGFIAWKEEQGFAVDIMRLSDLGSNPNYYDVKAAVQLLYDGANRPVYASIIGSTNNFPTHQSFDQYHPGNYDDDLYYAQLAGSDLMPDVFFSRFPVVDGSELTTMLTRILHYEQTPQMDNPGFYKTALMACSNLYPSQQVTKEQTRDRLYTNLNYLTVHEMYDWQNHGDPVSMVMDWINNGVSLINYRGEGWQAGWHPLHVSSYYIEYPEIYTLSNYNCFPVVTSIGCGVNMFDGYQDCFGHAFVTHGSPTNMKGAVAIIGPTWNTRTTINNWIDRGLYRGFCYHNITRSGPVHDYGKIYAYEHFIGTQYMDNDIPTHMKEYVIFGNPDLWWRTDVPRSAEIYNAWCADSEVEGVVIIDETGRKLANTQLRFMKDGDSRVYVTDGGGGCKVFMDDVIDPIPCTITGWNLIPSVGYFSLPETGDDGDLVITEIKPDIETTGTVGDKVEIANLETSVTINLDRWTIGDLDGYDLPFVNRAAYLEPQKVAVIEFVGYNGVETVSQTSYGLYITSRAVIGLSSEEDCCVLRNTQGRIRDAVAWHNGTGIGSTDETYDLSKLTQPTSSLSMGVRSWWTGPDEVTREGFESLVLDWSLFVGNGGPGSIKRIGLPGAGVYDSPAYFEVSSFEDFGNYGFPSSGLKLE